MMVQQVVSCRGFNLCLTSINAEDLLVHKNAGDGLTHQMVYVYKGSGFVTENGQTVYFYEKQLIDVSVFSDIAEITYHPTADCTSLSILPIPATKKYTIELLPTGDTTVTSNTSECVLLCIDKEITCNSKTLTNLQYARILNGKTATVNVPEGAVAALMTV